MNKKQKIVLWIGIAIVVLMCLFPPWIRVVQYEHHQSVYNTGYHFFLTPPQHVWSVSPLTGKVENIFDQWIMFHGTPVGPRPEIRAGSQIKDRYYYRIKEEYNNLHPYDWDEEIPTINAPNEITQIAEKTGINPNIVESYYKLIWKEESWLKAAVDGLGDFADDIRIDFARLIIQCVIVSLITGGLLCTLRTEANNRE